MKNKIWKIIGFTLTYIGMMTLGFLCGVGYIAGMVPELTIPTIVYVGMIIGLLTGYVGMMMIRLSIEGEIDR